MQHHAFFSPLRSKLPCTVTGEFKDGDRIVVRKFELLEEIGKGGMGTVYLARDLDRPNSVIDDDPFVAVKYLEIPPAPMDEDPKKFPEEFQRFQREYKLASKINHPNFVRVFEMYIDSEYCTFIVMELVKNARTLADLIESGGSAVGKVITSKLPMELLLPVMIQVAECIKTLHDRGIIHRDIKPANVLVTEESSEIVAKIFDLGIAKDLNVKESQKLTQDGKTLGTPLYMSPDQLKCDFREETDWWAFGIMLYECLTGHTPFEAVLMSATFRQILFNPPTPIEEYAVDVDPSLKRLIDGCLRKEPEDRMQYSEVMALLGDAEDRLHSRAARSKFDTLEVKPGPKSRNSPLPAAPASRPSAPRAKPETSGLPRYFVPLVVVLTLVGSLCALAVMRFGRSESFDSAPQGAPIAAPVVSSAPPLVTPIGSPVPTVATPIKKIAAKPPPVPGSRDAVALKAGLTYAANALRLHSNGACLMAERALLPLPEGYRDAEKALAECYFLRNKRDFARDRAKRYLQYEGSDSADLTDGLRKLLEP